MALTLNARPYSAKLNTTPNTTYSIIDDGSGNAILSGGSGLSGSYVMIVNSLESYNGFYQINAGGPGQFILIDINGSVFPAFTQTFANVTVYDSISDPVQWHSVNLPIVYGITTDLWPVNTSIPSVSVSSFDNDNGYVKLTLSGAVAVEVLDWLSISGSSLDALDGPFQVITKYSTTQFTINAPYSLAFLSPYTYLGAVANKYYNNYHVLVRIYAGLMPSHQWASFNELELITELKLTPESVPDGFSDGGIVYFSISDAVKQKLNIRKNRPNQDAIPYDLDRFSAFYLSWAETYDVQGQAFTSSYHDDNSEVSVPAGVAYGVDSALEFKNMFSGVMAEYAGAPVKFLSDTSIPTLFPSNYFDISFIKSDTAVMVLVTKNYDAFDNLLNTTTDNQSYTSVGVIRLPVSRISTESKKKITLYSANSIGAPESNNTVTVPGRWTRETSPSPSTIFTALAEGWTVTSTNASFIYFFTFLNQIPAGMTIPSFRISITYTSAVNGAITAGITTMGAGGQTIGSATLNPVISGSTSNIDTTSYVTSGVVTGIRIQLALASLPPTGGTIYAISISNLMDTYFPYETASEEKIIAINSECFGQFIYLTWKNPLGGFDYWLFTGNKDYSVNILDTQERSVNVISNWPNSYAQNADTLSYEASRKSRREMLVRSQNLTREQQEFVSGIKSSSLVQQMTSQYDRRTMIVDKNSFKIRGDADHGPYTIEFTIRETNDIASQTL